MESMEEIYQNHSKKVYTFLLSKTCNHELAEELTQETFFCAVNSINKFKGNSSVLTWLCGIAQNLWLKYLRDNKSFEDLSNYEDMLLKQRYTNTHTTNCFFSTSRLFWIPYFCRQPMILYPSIALIQRFQTGIYIWLRAMMKRYEIVLTI